MMWTRVELTTRRILASGRTDNLPTVGPRERLIAGVQGNAEKHRATADYTGLEVRPALAVTTSPDPASVGEGEALELSAAEPFLVLLDGETLGLIQEVGTVGFAEAGTYRLVCRPVQQQTTALPTTLDVTVTPGGTPVATDLSMGERRGTLRAAVRGRLSNFDLAISRAEAREASAEAVRTATLSNAAEIEGALRELARISRQTNNDLALALRHIRRSFFALVELIERRGG